MKEIKAWLISNRDYVAGVELYNKYGTSDVLKKIFKKQETTFNKTKLLQELNKLSEKAIEKIEEVKQQKETGIYVGNDFEILPQDVKGLIERAKFIYKEIGALKSKANSLAFEAIKLPDIASANKFLFDAGVGDLVNIIRDKDEEREELLYKIDFFKTEKRLPDALSPVSQTVMEMTEGAIMKRLQQLRPQITKHKKNPKRLAEYTNWCAERDELERRLSELV